MADLKASIGVDITDLQQGLKRAEGELTGFLNKIDNIAAIGSRLQNIGQSLTVGLTLPIVALGGASIKAYGEIQSLQKGLEAVMGSASAAGSEFNKLKEVAKLPGLGMQEAVRGSINLQAIGINADRSRKILQEFGNAVATVGKGRAEFDRAIYGVQQLANTDFPLGEDLNIIKDALPQVSNLLKEAFGSSRSDELAAMGVSSQQVLDTILGGLEKLPRVTGGINGAFENLGDTMRTNLGRIGKIIDDAFDISAIIDKVTSFVDKVVSAFESLNPAIQKSILIVGGLVAAAGPLIAALGLVMASLPSIIAGFGALKVGLVALTGPIGLVTVGLVGIVAAVVTNWNKIEPYLVRTINNFISLYNESEAFRTAVLSIGFAFESVYTVIREFFVSAYNGIKSFGKAILETFEGISLMVRGALTGDVEMMSQGIAKANTKAAFSFDNLTASVDRLEKRYNSFKRNEKPLVSVKSLGISAPVLPSAGGGANGGIPSAKELQNTVKGVRELSTELNGLQAFRAFRAMEDDITSLAGTFKQVGIADVIAEENEKLSSAAQTFIDTTERMFAPFVELKDRFNQAFESLTKGSLSDGISDAFNAIGEAIGSGGNVLNAMGQSVLSSLGQFLSQLGKQFIAYGTAVALFGKAQIALMSPEPFTKIPAGLALAAAGAAIAVAGGVIKGIAGGGNRGGSYSGGTFTPDTGVRSYSSSYGASSTGSGEVVFRIEGRDLVGVLERNQSRYDRLT